MYCVKCGVRLQDGASLCPLCGTPVWNPDETQKKAENFSDIYPKVNSNSLLPAAIALTILIALAELIVFGICLNLYGELLWGGYVMLALADIYVIAVLPLWFRQPNPVIFLPIDHAATAGLVLYICLATGGNWFLSFAFPVIGMSCLLSTALTGLLRYTKHGKYYIFGGFFIVLGGCTMLLEFFEAITFHTKMFRWSLFSAGICVMLGIFLLVAAMFKPLRRALQKRFFL